MHNEVCTHLPHSPEVAKDAARCPCYRALAFLLSGGRAYVRAAADGHTINKVLDFCYASSLLRRGLQKHGLFRHHMLRLTSCFLKCACTDHGHNLPKNDKSFRRKPSTRPSETNICHHRYPTKQSETLQIPSPSALPKTPQTKPPN